MSAPRRVRGLVTPLMLGLSAGLLALGGCMALPWPSAPRVSERVPSGPYLDLRGVVHVHTRASHDGGGGLGDLIDAAHHAGLAWIALGEHSHGLRYPSSQGRLEGITLIPGFEVNAAGGTILAIGIEQPPERSGDPGMIVRQIHAAGGLAFIGHFERSRLVTPAAYEAVAADGVELVNLHANALDAWLRLALRGLLLPSTRALGALAFVPPENLSYWHALPGAYSIVGGVDAHSKLRLLGPLGGSVDRYRDLLRVVTTHVLARDAGTAAILDALQAGRSYIAFEGVAGVDHFVFEQVGPRFRISAPVPALLTLVCDGVPAASRHALGAEFSPPSGATRCHAEARLDGRLWVVTSARALRPLQEGSSSPGQKLP